MTTTPDPTGGRHHPTGGQGPGGQGAGSGTPGGFFPWLRSLQIHRDPDERWFTGVAGGIALKAGIDPLIVRGIFVVLAVLGGPGIVLYVAAWLLLPDPAGTIHAEDFVRGRASTGVVVAVVLLGLWFLANVFVGINIPGVHWSVMSLPGIPIWFGSTLRWVFWAVVLVGVGLLIHRLVLHHGQNQPVPSAEQSAAPTDQPVTFTQPFNDATQEAQSWSAHYAEEHEKRKLGVGHILISAAVALIAAGGAALWVVRTGTDGPNAAAIAALAAATGVLAISMIVAGLRGKHAGTVGVFAFLGAVALAVTALVPSGSSYHLIGQNTLTDPAPSSFSVVGDTNIDLALYDSDPTLTQVELSVIAGEVNIRTSGTRRAELTLDVAAGTIDAPDFGGQNPGALVRRTIVVNDTAPGETLHVHVRLGAGTITVTP